MARKKKKERIPFTEDEIKFILETPLQNLKDLAFMMKRSYDSVRRKKWALENKARDKRSKKAYRTKIQYAIKEGKRDYGYWSKMEEELILTSKLPDFELAQQLNRSVSSIQVKRVRLLKEKENGRHSKKVRRNNKQG